MILYLTDDQGIARSIRNRNPSRPAPADAPTDAIEVHVLPPRPIAAATLAASRIGRHGPDLVVVAITLEGDESDRIGVIARVQTGGERWLPDALFKHEEETLSVRSSGEDRRADQCAIGAAPAAALGAVVEAVGPTRVVALAAGGLAVGRLAELAVRYAARALESVRTAEAAREGPPAVESSVRLGGELADRLRLTVTQRRKFLQTVRSAAVRGGVVPGPLASAAERPAARADATKAMAKRRLAELERDLEEWRRADG